MSGRDDLAERPRVLVPGRKAVKRELRKAHDDSEEVVEVAPTPPRGDADRLHLLGVAELLLEAAALISHVLNHGNSRDGAPVVVSQKGNRRFDDDGDARLFLVEHLATPGADRAQGHAMGDGVCGVRPADLEKNRSVLTDRLPDSADAARIEALGREFQ